MGKRLTAVTVARAKHSGKKSPDKFYDGNGLILFVQPSGSKQWVWQGTVDGRRKELGLGGYPVVSLREAREKAFEFKKIARSGGDPAATVRKKRIPTFAEAAERCFALQRSNWKETHAARWWASLRDYAIPKIGKIPVDKVTGQDVSSCIESHWETKQDTMRRVRQRISAVMRWAIAQGFRADNPAGDAISAALPKHNGGTRHFRALPYSEVGAAIEKIRQSGAHIGTKLAFEFLVLTATRSGEARNAQWDEVDLEKRVWTIPGERMKTGKEHRVPLSKRAVEILREARELPGKSGLVFPSITDRPLSDATMSKLVKENGIQAVPHGFRSSFKDWCTENGVLWEVAEACLAHVIGNKVERAYLRSDLFDLRREVMDRWGAFVS